ncbi:MAG: hydrogenase nickel incorporation protein HypB [Bacillota bacterium]
MGTFIDGRGNFKEIELKQDLLQDHWTLAAANRRRLDRFGVKMIEFMGSVGTGKTSLIQQLVHRLKNDYSITVINGDLATTIDQERILACGVDALQINTGKECHLDAATLKGVLERLDLEQTDLILVENVGNLICPVDFPLGAHRRLLVISVTEGPYVALKHPTVFMEMEYVAVNKIDLAPVMDVDLTALVRDIMAIRPATRVFPVSCKEQKGIGELAAALVPVQ